MKLVVCVKQVPDSAAKVAVEGGKVTWGDAPLVMIRQPINLGLARAFGMDEDPAVASPTARLRIGAPTRWDRRGKVGNVTGIVYEDSSRPLLVERLARLGLHVGGVDHGEARGRQAS